MSTSRNLVSLVFLLLLLGGGFAIWNASQQKPVRPATTTPVAKTANAGLTGQKATFIVTEGEIKKWKLVADKVTYDDQHIESQLDGVTGEFYDPDGKVVMAFSAPKGTYISKNHQVTLTGGVVASSSQKDAGEMLAPTMSWDIHTDRLKASGGVTMKFPKGESHAQSCRFSMDFSMIELQGGVESNLISPK